MVVRPVQGEEKGEGMKLLNAGDPGHAWWCGAEVVCGDCNFNAILEFADSVSLPEFVGATERSVRVGCPNCHVTLEVFRQEHMESPNRDIAADIIALKRKGSQRHD
jgi:hypothetical protein